MPFNTAISGLRASSDSLKVAGNNISNASTVGFKASRAEFADVYSSSVLGTGGNAIGSGTRLTNVAQKFTQGNTAFTSNSLDMAINGNGFFILTDDGALSYTRNGSFHLDREGFIVDSQSRSLQGFRASSTGAIGGNLETLQIQSDNLPPQQTTDVDAVLNVDAEQIPPERRIGQLISTGTDINTPSLNAAGNGYTGQTFNITDPNGVVSPIVIAADATANAIGALLTAIEGVNVTSSNSVVVDFGALATTNTWQFSFNGIPFPVNATAQEIAIEINNQTNNGLPGVSASIAGTALTISANTGVNFGFSVAGGVAGTDAMTFTGDNGTTTLTANGGTQAMTVGGQFVVNLDEGYTIDDDGVNDGTLLPTPIVPTTVITNAFDPSVQDTYNHATSLNVFDSLGNPHVLSLYFVKESESNRWTAYVQLDDENVGDPNPALPSPQNVLPTLSQYTLQFNSDGSLNDTLSDEIHITNWTPLNSEGDYNGSLRPTTIANGATLPIPDPPTDSNFVVNLTGTTQFGSPFSVNAVSQNGFTTGRLSGLDINAEGIMFARYTNGQARTLGQVALAGFNNTQGLSPLGETNWGETFESGQATVGTPGSAALGAIQAGALEESNVDLSQELVQLIIAQRNFQASAKTIQTADTVTQTIINLR
ncbi:MAG: flagellar biosynthesis protein FlgE [Gammaproteobacteria bacterium]|nr:MAG: flagellar biosynthesis protein FlgE [Gammaproteobacteria bacterium]